MKHSQKARLIITTCMVMVGLFSVFVLYKNFRPSRGLPYERLTMDQALEYMEYEGGYVLVDVGTPEEFAEGHIPEAINIPYDTLLVTMPVELPDFSRQIYLYGHEKEISDKAARKLCELGYSSITAIGLWQDWLDCQEETNQQ